MGYARNLNGRRVLVDHNDPNQEYVFEELLP
jgi:hypothetical protein